MAKFKFVCGVLAALVVFYLFLSVLMPLFVDISDDTVTAIANSGHAAEYATATAGARYVPLYLYISPAVVAIVIIMYGLNRQER